MSTQAQSHPRDLPPLPDPLEQPWEWAVVLASGDKRAWEIQRLRQKEAIDLIKHTSQEASTLSPDDEWDILKALNETRLAAGRPPLFERDEERAGAK